VRFRDEIRQERLSCRSAEATRRPEEHENRVDGQRARRGAERRHDQRHGYRRIRREAGGHDTAAIDLIGDVARRDRQDERR
jgi:hypothetical protein